MGLAGGGTGLAGGVAERPLLADLPGSTEHGYSTQRVTESTGDGSALGTGRLA